MVLELKDIVKKYNLQKGAVFEALRGVSFAFPDKGMMFVVGKSGSGKSTLLNVLGLLDDFDSGEYLIDGKSSKEFTGAERDTFLAQNIGFVFQEFHIIDKYTIGQNVSLPLEISRTEDKTRVTEVLGKVGLGGFENRKPGQLSGGQKQRVAIARAIIKDPKIVLADEPTGALDSVIGKEIFDILKNISKDKLVIVISHDLDSAHRYADKIIELKDGQVTKIYDGDGGAESVELVVDKVTPATVTQIKAIIDSGKKAVVKRKPETAPKPVPSVLDRHSLELGKSSRLPYKSVARLSFFSVRSKWARTFFTVLIAALSVAFFGFADLVSRYDIKSIITQELSRENLGFVEVGIERFEQAGAFKNYTSGLDDTMITDEKVEKFNELGFESAFPRRLLYLSIDPHFNKFKRFLPNNRDYYRESIPYITEVDDFSKLGMNIIAGRAPNFDTPNTLEIAITTYHMECYKLFGFENDDLKLDTVTDFSQIEGQILNKYRKYGLFYPGPYYNVKIVGLIQVDTSKYAELANITRQITSMSKDQRALADQCAQDNFRYFGNAYVAAGFYEKYNDISISWHIRMKQASLGDRITQYIGDGLAPITNRALNDPRVVLKEGITSAQDFGDNQIIMDIRGAVGLFPELKEFTEDEEWVEFYKNNILGKTLRFESAQSPWFYNTVDVELEIIGIFCSNDDKSSCNFISSNVLDAAKVDVAFGYKIPVQNDAQRLAIVKKVSKAATVKVMDAGEENTYEFFVNASGYRGFRQLDMYFSLFIEIFLISAFVLCAFTILLTYFFISQSINLRKKDIGILRSLGARKMDIANIFIVEGIVITIAEIIFGALLCFGAFKILSAYFVDKMGTIAKTYTLINFTFRQVLLIGAVTVLSIAVSLFFPIWRISRKTPIEAIRSIQ
jgi:ABC-type lipoprotein export system ATPase subunit